MSKVTFLIAGGDATFFKNFALPQNFVPLGFIYPRSHAYMLSVASIVLIPQVLGHGLRARVTMIHRHSNATYSHMWNTVNQRPIIA